MADPNLPNFQFDKVNPVIANKPCGTGNDGCPCCRGWRRWLTVGIAMALAIAAHFFFQHTPVFADDSRVPAKSAPGKKASTDKKPAGDYKTADKEQEEPQQEYVRIRKNEKKLAVALETSVVTFGKSPQFPNATVDLIGAIHLGEPEYYSQLNELFKKYDVLLYEAVMPEEAVKNGMRPGGGEGARRGDLSDEQEWTDAKVGLTAISVLQLGMKDALGMEFQLSGVDYMAPNFVHADMTQEEFESSMSRRGETFSGMFLKEMGKSVAAQPEQNPIAMNLDIMLSALSSDRAFRIRRIAAVQLAKAGEGDAFAGFDGTSTIITERNKKCLDVMVRELKNSHLKVGIFYGAGHFADMEKRMVDEHKFQRTQEEWLVAWNLRDPKAAERKKDTAPKTSP
jgi:hypothetical protein